MIKRDLSNDAIANTVFRMGRALGRRVRGYCYILLGVFNDKSGKKVFFGHGGRFINTKAMIIGERVNFGIFARLETFKGDTAEDNSVKVTVGDNTSFGDYFHIGAAFSIAIGKDVLVGSNVLITDHNHGQPMLDLQNEDLLPPNKRKLSGGKVTIADCVWIGDGAVILPGASIGYGAIVAANSVVKGVVPARSIYFGENNVKCVTNEK